MVGDASHTVVGVVLDQRGRVTRPSFHRTADCADDDDDEWRGTRHPASRVLHQGHRRLDDRL